MLTSTPPPWAVPPPAQRPPSVRQTTTSTCHCRPDSIPPQHRALQPQIPMQHQHCFFPNPSQEHGGSLSVKRRRSRRALATRKALHVTLKSDLAVGARSLKLHHRRIQGLAERWGRRFGVKTYRFAVCATHLHFLIRGTTREGLQNFFRVFSGQLAQSLLQIAPLKPREERPLTGCAKNHRKFWSVLTYTRVISWGREFKSVAMYILKNQLETLHLIAYEPRSRPKRRRSSS